MANQRNQICGRFYSQLVLGFLVLLNCSCAIQPFPYYDSAINDHNRAPSSVALPSQSDSPQAQTDYLFMMSELNALEGENQKSLELLKAAHELDPQSVTIIHRIASEYYKLNKIDEALEWVEKALKIKPKQQDLNILAAGLYTSKKQYSKAEAIYLKLMNLDKNNPEPVLYFAAVKSEQKKYVEAIKYFTKLTKFRDYEQKYLAYYYNARTKFEYNRVKYFSQIKSDLKSSLNEKSDYLEALQFLGQLIEKTEGKKKVFEFYADHQKKHGPIGRLAEVLSQYYLEIGDYDKAYKQLEIVENSTFDPIQVKLKMALILIDKKENEKALLRLEELSALVPESDKVKFYLASLYQETKRFDQAAQTYLQIQSSSKYYEDATRNAAFILKDSGHADQSENLLKKLTDEKPNNIQNYLAYAQFLDDMKKYNEGISVLLVAESKFAKNAQVQYYLGSLFDKKQDKENMFKHMSKAIEIDPQHVQALNYLAYSLIEANKEFDKAETFALKAYSLDKEDPYITDTLGWIYYLKQDYQKAAVLLEKAHHAVPDVSVIADHLGDVYVKLNKFEKAYQLYQKAKENETDLEKLKQISVKITSIQPARDKLREPASVTVQDLNQMTFSTDRDESK